MKQFVPFTDDWFECQDSLPGPLVPFRIELPCRHLLDADAAAPDQRTSPRSAWIESTSPSATPMRAALPPASSRT